jgi:hypothetical protein
MQKKTSSLQYPFQPSHVPPHTDNVSLLSLCSKLFLAIMATQSTFLSPTSIFNVEITSCLQDQYHVTLHRKWTKISYLRWFDRYNLRKLMDQHMLFYSVCFGVKYFLKNIFRIFWYLVRLKMFSVWRKKASSLASKNDFNFYKFCKSFSEFKFLFLSSNRRTIIIPLPSQHRAGHH